MDDHQYNEMLRLFQQILTILKELDRMLRKISMQITSSE